MNRVILAMQIAASAHRNHQWGSGTPYFEHCKQVAAGVTELTEDEDSVVIAWLHDVVEDGGVSFRTIKNLFGDEVMFDVAALTRRRGSPSPSPYGESAELETYQVYIERVAKRPRALLVKRVDIAVNLAKCLSGPERYEGLTQRYQQALQYLNDYKQEQDNGESDLSAEVEPYLVAGLAV